MMIMTEQIEKNVDNALRKMYSEGRIHSLEWAVLAAELYTGQQLIDRLKQALEETKEKAKAGHDT